MVTSEQIKMAIELHKRELPRYRKLFDYYIGKHDILNRVLQDSDKPNNKIVTDYPGIIIDTVLGYLITKPVSYLSKDANEKYLKELNQVFLYNDEEDENAEVVKGFSIFGKSYELMWIDKKGNIRFKDYSPLEMAVVKDRNDNIQFALRYWTIIEDKKEKIKVELYDDSGIHYYYSNDSEDFIYEDSTQHFFGEVPVIIYKNNDEEIGDFEKFIPLIDGIDKLLSDSANELEYWVNAYMYLVGYDGTTTDDALKMKQNGILLLQDKGEAGFLTKEVNNQFQQNFFETVDKLIHNQTATPKLTSEEFSSNLSGTAIGFKLFGLEAKSSVKERKMLKGLRKRIRLITEILNKKSNNNYSYTNISIQFSRNLPQNESEITDEMTKLNGMVDLETLLSWHPRIQEPRQVIGKLKKEQDSLNLDETFEGEE